MTLAVFSVCWDLCFFRKAWVANITAFLLFFNSGFQKASGLLIYIWKIWSATSIYIYWVYTTCLLSGLAAPLHNFLRMSPQYWDCRGSTSDSLDDAHCLYLAVDLTYYRYVWRRYESPALKEKIESRQLYKPHPPFARGYSHCLCCWANFFPVLLKNIWMQAILQISVTFFHFFFPIFFSSNRSLSYWSLL